jgi:2-furoyl-CoA dehydrogenase FAD binding subunit
MKPAPFRYIRPDTADEAIAALAAHGPNVKILAGGQSLGAMLNLRLARAGALVDIGRVAELDHVRVEGSELIVGAGVTQAALLARPTLVSEVPLLAQALPHVGHFQTRNRGTVCGSLCHADPSSELPLCLAALGGSVTVAGPSRRRRRIPVGEFQTGMLTTSLAPDEMVIDARFPTAAPGATFAFHEIARRHGDFAIVAVAAVRTGTALTLGIGGVADRPHVEIWPDLLPSGVDDALNELAWRLDPAGDIHASARYRREMVRRIGRKAIMETAID